MKRSPSNFLPEAEDKKKMKIVEEKEGFQYLDENLVFEVLKHVDRKTLVMSSCISKMWHNTTQDERLWELICTRHLANIGYGKNQLRCVVLALGGFRRLHSLYLWPLSNPNPHAIIGKDELKISLSLLSIRYYEKMSFAKRLP